MDRTAASRRRDRGRLFESAVVAFKCGDFEQAEALFLEDAQEHRSHAPQRAAIAFRQASLAAQRCWRPEDADHWMYLAGLEYLRVSEDPRTPLTLMRQSAIMAARCFFTAREPRLGRRALQQVLDIDVLLTVDDDLLKDATLTNLPVIRSHPRRDRPALRMGAPGGPAAGSGN